MDQSGIEISLQKRLDHLTIFQKVDRGKNRVVNRDYRPIDVTGFCLTCRGAVVKCSSNEAETPMVRYPNDEAIGYTSGGFRGLIRVKISD